MNSSWKTSTAAITTIVAAVSGAAKLMLDADPSTNPDWSLLIPQIIAAVGLLFARDNDKTSEDVGAMPPAKYPDVDHTPKKGDSGLNP